MITPSHKLTVGSHVLIYNTVTKSKVARLPQLQNGFSWMDNAEYREIPVEKVEVMEQKPFIGAIPWEIVKIELPIILVRSCINRKPRQIPPMVLMDCNLINFVVIPPDFVEEMVKGYNEYFESTGKATISNDDSQGSPIVETKIIELEARVKSDVEELCAHITENSDAILKDVSPNNFSS